MSLFFFNQIRISCIMQTMRLTASARCTAQWANIVHILALHFQSNMHAFVCVWEGEGVWACGSVCGLVHACNYQASSH